MKVELNHDPLFERKVSPVKQLKDKQRERQRQIRAWKGNPTNEKVDLNIQIIDPLKEELQKYKNLFEYKKNFDSSKASQKLKKYIIEQERNLKCLRLERIDFNLIMDSSRVIKSRFQPEIQGKNISREEEGKHSKEIHIPEIQQMFQNQQKQFMLFQSKVMRNQLTKAMNQIENGVSRIKSYSFGEAPVTSVADTRKSTTDKFPNIHGLSRSITNSSHLNQEDYEIDKKIQKNLILSQKLREKLSKEKKQILSNQTKVSSEKNGHNFFLSKPKKLKKKIILSGVKSVVFSDGDKEVKVTPASCLLFSLHNMSNGKQRKQQQLEGLIKNSFQNRESILSEKSNFYQQQSPLSNLNPSNQFRLRQLMDRKLAHRLELSKEQINNFVTYLSEIKGYHVILNETMLEILKEVRQNLLSGKVMKSSNLSAIVASKPKDEIEKYPNGLILQKLASMMI